MNLGILEVPSTRSVQFRLGMLGGTEAFPEHPELGWRPFLDGQSRRLLKAMIRSPPLHAMVNETVEGAGFRGGWRQLILLIPTLLFFVYVLVRFLRRSPHRLSLLTVALSGFFWILPMKNFTTFHDLQRIFCVGFVLVVFYAILSTIPRKLLWGVASISFLLFFSSSWVLNEEKAMQAVPFAVRNRDFVAIQAVIGQGQRIQVGAKPEEFTDILKQLRFYMAGNYYAEPSIAD